MLMNGPRSAMDQFQEPKEQKPRELSNLATTQKKRTPSIIQGQAQAWRHSRLLCVLEFPSGPGAVLAGFSVCNVLQISGPASDSSDISELSLTSASYLKA